MKKITMIAAAILCLAGCSKEYRPNGIVGGNEYYAYSPTKDYMMAIVDNMVTDALEELETAFKVEGLGYSSSVRFDKSAGSILDQGITWKVIGQERALLGMTIRNIGSDTWEMAYDGPYSLRGDFYPVNFIMKAKRGSLITGNHYNWGVTLSGNRTEREGYSCTYATNNTVLYMCTQDNTVGWNYLEGSYSLTVMLNGQPIDLWAMIFKGKLSDTEFTRGI